MTLAPPADLTDLPLRLLWNRRTSVAFLRVVEAKCRGCYDEAVLAFDPDAVLLGTGPPPFDRCDLLSQIKGSEHTQDVRVLILSQGGSAERIRGIGLGADDVLSVPFEARELLSRVRSQLRNRHLAHEIRERLRIAEENRNDTQRVVAAVNEERRTLRVGSLAIVALLVVGALVSLLLYRRTQEQNTLVYAAITRLQAGVVTQQQLTERSRPDQEEMERAASPARDPQKLQLLEKGEELGARIATSDRKPAYLATPINRGRRPLPQARD